MSQSFSLYGELSVRQNLELHARLFDLPTTDSRQRIDELIQRFNLQALADQPSGSLPLGLRQRLSLAVAVLHRPEVLILDEPTSGVDPAARDDFWRLLIELSREQGVTIFLSTHFMNEAQRCDRISLMHAGKVLACDTPAALQAQFNGQTLEAAFVTCLEKAQGETQQDAAPVTLDSADAPRDRRGLSLGRLWAVASREGKELLRDKVRMAFALLGALFMMVVFGFGISLDVEKLAFAVYDQDQSPQSRAYLEAFRSSRYFEEQPIIRDAKELHRRLQRSEIKLALEIPLGLDVTFTLAASRQWAPGWTAAYRFEPRPVATTSRPCTRPTLSNWPNSAAAHRTGNPARRWRRAFATTRTWSASTPSALGSWR